MYRIVSRPFTVSWRECDVSTVRPAALPFHRLPYIVNRVSLLTLQARPPEKSTHKLSTYRGAYAPIRGPRLSTEHDQVGEPMRASHPNCEAAAPLTEVSVRARRAKP